MTTILKADATCTTSPPTPQDAAPPTSHTALLLIDNQLGFQHPTHWGPARSNPRFEANTAALLAAFRAPGSAGAPPPLIIHVYHASSDDWPDSPLHPAHPSGGIAFLPFAAPLAHEPVLSKSVNSSFIGTRLEALLRERQIRRLFIQGLSTDHCVSTTTRMAGNLHVCDHVDAEGERVKGEVILVADATAAWEKPGGRWDAETVHAVHVESLREFATVLTTEQVIELVKE
ncbi:Isochorismatase hydrolase [Athelia psychrophila]|uniref:Isochorismatase hydrolase n=1 Tax=Athelia psychrophila TaxID=1759441 RepID=A0A166AKN0_9AGAM|nr:Isochorismatase hydrolase [Fibularhizoctonia sp. CBS 109695]